MVGFAIKRGFDLILGGILIVILAPLFAVVGIAIKLDSPGPVFFIQDRVGVRRRVLDGRVEWSRDVFSVFKFRSMTTGVDQTLHREYIESFVAGNVEGGASGPEYKLQDDARVTRVGRLIRRTSIDELPQLLNVVKGDMSLVGPRPVPTYEIAGYASWHFERFDALPGMTGYWQIHGRGRVPFDEMMEMDIHYVRNQSLALDLKLLALTLPAVVSARGAG